MANTSKRPTMFRRFYKYILVLLALALYKFQSVIRDIYGATRSEGVKLRDMAAKRLARNTATTTTTTTTSTTTTAAKKEESQGDWSRPAVEERAVHRDGVRLVYKVAKLSEEHGKTASSIAASKKRPTKVVLYCCPLGWTGFDALDPLLAVLGSEYEFICWDYRGFFKSSLPKSERMMSIHEHARDGAVVLRDFLNLDEDCTELPEGVKVIVAGHSMGVQVGLEFALLYPKLVSANLFYNGAHGHVFSTAYQSIVSCFGPLRIPFVSSTAPMIASLVVGRPWLLPIAYENLYNNRVVKFVMKMWGISPMGSPMLRRMKGDDYLFISMDDYFRGVVSNIKTCRSYARSFQELDMHSVKHVMHAVHQPTLLISGMWDFLTPCSHMFDMAKALPNVTHRCDVYSTHATMLENPEYAVEHSMAFLADHGLLGNDDDTKIENKTQALAIESAKSDNRFEAIESTLPETAASRSSTPPMSRSQKESERSQDSSSDSEEEELRSADSRSEDPLASPATSDALAERLQRMNRGDGGDGDEDGSSCSSSSTCGDIDDEDMLLAESEQRHATVV